MTEQQVERAFCHGEVDEHDATGDNIPYAGEEWEDFGPIVTAPEGTWGWVRLGSEIVITAVVFTVVLVLGKIGWEVLAWLAR